MQPAAGSPQHGQIDGIEEAGQTKALVLQLVEGPTLADKIAQGPIPVEEVKGAFCKGSCQVLLGKNGCL